MEKAYGNLWKGHTFFRQIKLGESCRPMSFSICNIFIHFPSYSELEFEQVTH